MSKKRYPWSITVWLAKTKKPTIILQLVGAERGCKVVHSPLVKISKVEG